MSRDAFRGLPTVLRLLRARRGWSQAELAKRGSVSEQQLSGYETHNLPLTGTLGRLLAALGCNLIDLHETLVLVRAVDLERASAGKARAPEWWQRVVQEIWPLEATNTTPETAEPSVLDDLGAALRLLRSARGKTLREIGDALDVNRQQIARLERTGSMELSTLNNVLGVLDADLVSLQRALTLSAELQALLHHRPQLEPEPTYPTSEAPPKVGSETWHQRRRRAREYLRSRGEGTGIRHRLALLSLGLSPLPRHLELAAGQRLQQFSDQLTQQLLRD